MREKEVKKDNAMLEGGQRKTKRWKHINESSREREMEMKNGN